MAGNDQDEAAHSPPDKQIRSNLDEDIDVVSETNSEDIDKTASEEIDPETEVTTAEEMATEEGNQRSIREMLDDEGTESVFVNRDLVEPDTIIDEERIVGRDDH